eukprot:TRINITY_DN97096_c0_g1_i1.p1 TRINITY_DN97096_c0_g1~~TRINITY_DN97096_c0_g1_i1.p1  ORF type:complete len:155 (-),score=29.02 TRINITY_DN97096_c0_g1_i1:88-552(-)
MKHFSLIMLCCAVSYSNFCEVQAVLRKSDGESMQPDDHIGESPTLNLQNAKSLLADVRKTIRKPESKARLLGILKKANAADGSRDDVILQDLMPALQEILASDLRMHGFVPEQLLDVSMSIQVLGQSHPEIQKDIQQFIGLSDPDQFEKVIKEI